MREAVRLSSSKRIASGFRALGFLIQRPFITRTGFWGFGLRGLRSSGCPANISGGGSRQRGNFTAMAGRKSLLMNADRIVITIGGKNTKNLSKSADSSSDTEESGHKSMPRFCTLRRPRVALIRPYALNPHNLLFMWLAVSSLGLRAINSSGTQIPISQDKRCSKPCPTSQKPRLLQP